MADPFRVNPTGQAGSQPAAPAKRQATPTMPLQGTPSFAEALAKAQNIKFSNHAQKRLQAREISLTEDSLERLATAVDKAEKRGGRESLVLMDNLAFIVNVRDRMIVTAVDTQNNGEGVFTQIDSVVLAEPRNPEPNEQ